MGKIETVEIDSKAIFRIMEHALNEFHERRTFGTMDQREIQMLLVVNGLYRYMMEKGVEPNFKVTL